MENEFVKIERDEKAEVAIVRIAREDKRNALNDAVLAGLADAANALRDDTSVKAIVLTGGRQIFSAGADVSTFHKFNNEPDLNRVRRMAHTGARLCADWENLPQLTIAAMEGGAIGGGLSIALACDWRVMARDAWCYVPEVMLGLNYGWGTLARLTALAGPARTKWMSLMCRRHPAAEMEEWGVANEVAPAGESLAAALQLAREVAGMPTLAAQLIKQSVNAHSSALHPLASHTDIDQMLLCLTDPEGKAARSRVLENLASKTKE